MYDPAGVGGTHVIYVLHDAKNPEDVRRPAERSAHPLLRVALEEAAEVAGQSRHVGGLAGLALHYLRFGPKKAEPIPPNEERRV